MLQTSLFLNEIVNFLRTVTIKNIHLADIVKSNSVTLAAQEWISDDMHPYYRHLHGEYILSDDTTNDIPNSQLYTKFDTMMQITAFDNLVSEQINFTKENLALYPKTAAEYRVPNSRYFTLCERYPDQIDLIKAIVYPIPSKEVAISAKNFSLLSYDANLLQETERAVLIKKLTDTLAYLRTRWDVKEFCYEEYYPLLQWSSIWYSLFTVLLGQRVENIKTINVHPTQIWEYLISKGLRDYRTILSIKQQLFLYKNIDYLLKNKGKNKTLSILADALLSEYGVNLRTKSLVQNTSESTITCKPTAEVISEEFEQNNNTPTENVALGIATISSIIDREYNDALEPSKDDAEKNAQQATFDRMSQSYLPTKLIELNKVPLNARFTQLYFNFITHSFLHQLITNKLNFQISINSSEIAEPLILTQGEAIALLIYCIGREHNITLNNIVTNFEIRYACRDSVTMPTTITQFDTTRHVITEGAPIGTPTAIDAHVSNLQLGPVDVNMVAQPINIQPNDPVTLGSYDTNSFVTYSHYTHPINNAFGADAHNILKMITKDLITSYESMDLVVDPENRYVNIIGNQTEISIPIDTLVFATEITRDNYDAPIDTLCFVLETSMVYRRTAVAFDIVSPWHWIAVTDEFSVKYNHSDLYPRITIESLLAMFPAPVIEFKDNVTAIANIDAQFEVIYHQLLYGLDSNNSLQNQAMHEIYQRLMITRAFTNNVLVAGKTTYDSWFAAIPELKQLMTIYNNKSKTAEAFGSLASVILEQLIPLTNSKFTLSSAFNTTRYQYMKSLFMQLCSYNIAFIDTDRSEDTYTTTTPVATRSAHIKSKAVSTWQIFSPVSSRPSYCRNRWSYFYGFVSDPSLLQLDTAANIVSNTGGIIIASNPIVSN